MRCFYFILSSLCMIKVRGENENYDVRLVGGDENEGRVSVYLNGKWGFVCHDDAWDVNDGRVVCRQLGFDLKNSIPVVVKSGVDPHYKNYRGVTHLANLDCDGSESSIKECKHTTGRAHCHRAKKIPAVVACKTPMRIRGGPSNSTGRLEIYKRGEWRSFCGTTLDYEPKALNFICSMAGVEAKNPMVVGANAFGQVLRPYWIFNHDVTAQGVIFYHDGRKCTHEVTRYLSIVCQRDEWDIASEVRIIGTRDYYGKVEVKQYGYWGGVSQITGNLYKVVCKQLGFNPKNAFKMQRPYWPWRPLNPTFRNFFYCTGKEATIKDCEQSKWVEMERRVSEWTYILHVTCDFQLRLVETKPRSRAGRVEVLHEGMWKSICRALDPKGAVEVCKHLGKDWKFAQPINLNNIKNLPKNNHSLILELARCYYYSDDYGVCVKSTFKSCSKKDDLEAGVSCRKKLFSDPKPTNEIRLEHGSNGALEVKDSFGEWFPVCGTNWTTGASQVVCNQLGFKAHFGFTLKPYRIANDYNRQIITNLNCNGTEKSLSECSYTEWTALYGSASAWHKERALECGANGIQLSCVDTSMKPRLVGGHTNTTGQLEVWYKQTWKKVCIVDGSSAYTLRSNRIAVITCISLGYMYGRVGTYGPFNQKKEPGRIKKGISLLCGKHDVLHMCNVTRADCEDNNMYISCFNQEPEFTDFVDIKGQYYIFRQYYILGGGLLRLNVPGVNKTLYICANGLSINEAKVACRQQGFDPKDAAVDTFSKYTCRYHSMDVFYMSDLICNGDEYNLADCSFKYDDDVSCRGKAKASVICEEVNVRLERGKTANSGLIEIHVDEMWRKYGIRSLFTSGITSSRTVCLDPSRRHTQSYKMQKSMIVILLVVAAVNGWKKIPDKDCHILGMPDQPLCSTVTTGKCCYSEYGSMGCTAEKPCCFDKSTNPLVHRYCR
ncbi:unnamed protein product [Owenia fusiformis]|uniref:SRCR domain-containing protein n=1 Tax=Owenia fusiformis TaxID=6347 RepID=A0A8S4NRG3_OWEFU|nr:unnamed protein product [Owenia fusiformis]